MPAESGAEAGAKRDLLRRILVTNDDGIDGPGLAVAETIAAALADEVWVVAPAVDQSGRSQAITVRTPVRVAEHGPRRFSVTGTPADCVLLALGHWLADTPPDLVISGVNRGANISDTVVYSGTVGAVLAADHVGLPAVALSQAFRGPAASADFSPAIAHGRSAIEWVLNQSWADETGRTHCAWSVNFPAADPESPIQGIALARPARGTTVTPRVVAVADEPGLFQLQFARGRVPVADQDSDVAVLRSRCIAATPLSHERCESAVFSSSTNRRDVFLDKPDSAR